MFHKKDETPTTEPNPKQATSFVGAPDHVVGPIIRGSVMPIIQKLTPEMAAGVEMTVKVFGISFGGPDIHAVMSADSTPDKAAETATCLTFSIERPEGFFFFGFAIPGSEGFAPPTRESEVDPSDPDVYKVRKEV